MNMNLEWIKDPKVYRINRLDAKASISYFKDRIRFYYIEDKEEQFIELSLFGFSKEVQEPLYDSCSGIWRHSDYCLWY